MHYDNAIFIAHSGRNAVATMLITCEERNRENLTILLSVIFCQREYCDNLSHKKHSAFVSVSHFTLKTSLETYCKSKDECHELIINCVLHKIKSNSNRAVKRVIGSSRTDSIVVGGIE